MAVRKYEGGVGGAGREFVTVLFECGRNIFVYVSVLLLPSVCSGVPDVARQSPVQVKRTRIKDSPRERTHTGTKYGVTRDTLT